MKTKQVHCAVTSQEVIDRYFLEHRAKLIDIAAFLDRIDRTVDARPAESDYRIAALLKAIAVLCDGRANRAGRILTTFSDGSTELPQSAEGVKGASGAAQTEEIVR